MWDRRAQVADIKDGDTIVAILDQGFGDTKQISVRMLGVFAPELKQPGGPECRQFVIDWIAKQGPLKWPFVVTTARTRTDHEVETFGRYVGTVTSLDGTDNLNLAVMSFVAANGYGGGTGG